MNEQQIAEYKQLKAKAEVAKANRIESYQVRKITRLTYKNFFLKNATATEKNSLEKAIANL